MELKTLKELKELIKAKGELKIGGLVLNLSKQEEANCDVDIHLNGRLLMWLTDPGNEVAVEDAVYQISSDFTGFSEKIKNLKDEKTELEDKLKAVETERDTLLNAKREGELALGKVEAYEKLLIGCDLSISK